MKKILGTTLIIFCYMKMFGQSHSSLASKPIVKDTYRVTMAAGEQYKASAWKSLWWGSHYRKEWTTPVQFPVLDLATSHGGLRPLKAGGGHQSKTLRLISNDGKEYVLRTIDKNLDALIPDELKNSYINDIVNDQISTAHPYGPIAISKMAGSLSLIHANPKIYYVPDDPGLEEFRETFANKLCLLEERPSGAGWEHTELFGNADKIVNTEKMLADVLESGKNTVDQHSFLDVRLFDMIVNDWDRHEDQWVWAMKKDKGHRLYTPIGRDRDQAFSKTDGINLYFLSRRYAFRPLQNMDHTVKDIRGANFSARNLDQQFLNELTKEDWKRSIDFIKTHLTDTAISEAINSMPEEVNKFSGQFLIRRLKQRRENLDKFGIKYYSMLAKKVTITGSDDDEFFIINKENKNEVSVTGFREGNDTVYHRIFNRNETKEINIYSLGGNDQFVANGNAKNKFTIRMIGGDGDDKYDSDKSSKGKSYHVYDSLKPQGLSRKAFRVNKHWDTLYNYKRASVKYDWYLPTVIPGYNQDDGFSVALGLLFKKQKWGKTPFGWQQQLLVNYATGTGAIGFGYKGLFKQAFGEWDFDLNAHYKGPRYTFNYYGSGNETELNGNDRSYFRVKANDLYASPGISRTWKSSYLRFGLQYENVEVLHSQDKFVTTPESKLDSSVFSSIDFAGVNGEWTISNVADQKYRRKGMEFTSGFSYFHNLDNTDRNMLKLSGAVSVYQPIFKWLTFSHRTGGSTIFGEYEFYQASRLGGSENLRGYWRDRFTGKTSFYQNSELRISFGNLRGYVIRGQIGVFGFFDDGRVWVKDDNSDNGLHTGYGGGIFLMPYNKAALTLYYASSKEKSIITLKSGFFF